MTRRLRRSFLYTPADDRRKVEKAADAGADAVVYDLQDAVPAEGKAAAREVLTGVVPDLAVGDTEVCVRVNPVGSDHWPADVAAALDAGADTLSLPLVESPEQVRTAVDAAERAATERGRPAPELLLILETPRGVFGGRAIAEACRELPPVTGLTFGVGDYARATGGTPTAPRIRSFLAPRIVGLAALGGLQPVSSVHPAVGEPDRLRAIAEAAAELGFVGQSVIHPDQVPVANEVFTPDEATVRRAREVLAGFEAAGGGATTVEGTFVDHALAERYRQVVARAEALEDPA